MVRDPEFLQNVPESSKKDFVSKDSTDAKRTKRLKKEVLERFPVSTAFHLLLGPTVLPQMLC